MTKTKINIEAIHDVVCSWCPIGYSNLKNALKQLESEVEAHITYLPFELNPDMFEEGETIANYFKHRHKWSSGTLKDYQESLVRTAQSAGVVIDFSKRTHYYNTRKAHKLIHWAEQFNKQTTVNESLIEAYFKQGLDISNTDVLLNIAEQLGMDRVSTKNALLSKQLELEIEKKFERQKAFKLHSIPAFIINGDTLVSGSNSVEFFEKTLSGFIDVRSLT